MKNKILIIFGFLVVILGICYTASAVNITELIGISAWEDVDETVVDRNDRVISTKYLHMDDGILREGEDLDKFTSEEQAQITADYESAKKCGNGYVDCPNHGDRWQKVINWGFDGYYKADLIEWYKRISNTPNIHMGWTTITELVDRLNSENPNDILATHASVFCIKHNHPLYYRNTMDKYHATSFVLDDYYELIWDSYDADGEANEDGTPDTDDYFNITDDDADESLDEIVNYSNIKFIASEEMDLKEIIHPFDGNIYDFAYIATFTEKDTPSTGFDSKGIKKYTGDYNSEIGQRAMWANTGAEASSFENTLYYAATAFDEYEEEVVEHKKSVEVNPDVNAGAVIIDDNSTYQVGPFYMSDYAYAYCSYAEGFSGEYIDVDEGLFGGIIDGYITLRDDNNVDQKHYINGDTVKVVYEGWNSSKGTSGNNNRSGSYWGAPQDSTNAAGGVNEYIYPWPNSTFYIEIDRDLCRESETLISMNFNYRETTSEGAGWVCKSRLIKHTWTIEDDYDASGCTYYCTTDECKRDGIAFSIRSDADNGKHKRYCVTTNYCIYGTENCDTHCGGDCGTCGHECGAGCEGEDGCQHECSSVSLDYCEHGYSDGDHMYSWKKSSHFGTTEHDWCTGVTRCSTHKGNNSGTDRGNPVKSHFGGMDESPEGHTTCKTSEWVDAPVVTDGQPLLAIHHASVSVKDNDYGSEYTGGTVRITTDVTIDKYIVKVEHTGVTETTFDSKTERRNKTPEEKLADFVKLERGDQVTFYIDVVNDQKEQVQYRFKDTLPVHEDCIVTVKSAKISTSTWKNEKFVSEISDSSWKEEKFTTGDTEFKPKDDSGAFTITGEIPGDTVKRFTVTMKVTGSDALQKNSVRIMYRNEGDTTDSDDWMRTSTTRADVKNGPVVNYAQLDEGKTEDEEYFYIKSYNVPVDKYIINVQHSTTGEVVYQRKELNYEKDYDEETGYTTQQKYFDRDVINDANKIFKQNSAVYLEYGDIVTYRIDLQNTYFSDEGERITESESPYYDPDGVVVDLKDTLPVTADNKLAVDTSSIAVKYMYKDSDGNIEPYQIGKGTSGSEEITDWRYTDHSASDKTSKGEIKFNVTYSVSGRILTIENLPVTEQTESYLEVSCIVDTPEFGTYENKVEITEVRNLNNYVANNTSHRTVSSDFFVLNEYKAILDNYIVGANTISNKEITNIYGAQMLIDNKGNNFENLYTYNTDLTKDGADTVTQTYVGNSADAKKPSHNRAIQNEDDRVSTETDRADYSVPMEKGETVKFEVKVKNTSIKEEGDLGKNGSYQYKYATRVRTSEIKEMLEDGLILTNVSARIYKDDGDLKHTVETVYFTDDGQETIGEKKYNIYTLKIGNKISNAADAAYTILEPNEWIIYTVTVEVTRSNMYLYNLENKAEIQKLTNINNNDGADLTGFENIFTGKYEITDLDSFNRTKERIVTEQNTVAANQKYSSDFIKLKDLIISGRVWLDLDKDGFMDSYDSMSNLQQGQSSNVDTERDMQGIIVRLYTSSGKLVRTTKTDSDGLYTFARYENGSYRNALDQRILKATKNDVDVSSTLDTYDMVTNYNTNSQYIDYYVEFEYDGVLYKATEIYGGINEEGTVAGTMENYGKDNLSIDWTTDKETLGELYKTDSNAYEFGDVRREFNTRYQTISHNIAYAYNGTIGGKGTASTLSYTKDGHESYLNLNHNRNMTARSFIKQGSDKSIDNTSLLWFYDVSEYLPETEYLKYINLGLEEREDADISLTKDVYEVKTTINGEEMTYEYNQNATTNNGNGETGRYLQDYQIKEPYGITLYESDYKYRHTQYENQAVEDYKGKESELNVEVTYKITVTNNRVTNNELLNNGSYKDIQLNTTVHEILDLYDENFMKFNGDQSQTISVRQKDTDGTFKSEDKQIKIAEAWCYDKEGNKRILTLSNSSIYSTKANNFTTDGYNTLYISGMADLVINEGENLDVFVKYVVDKESEDKDGEKANALKIKDYTGKTTSIGTENIAQINSYSIWYKDGKPTSLVEMDSNAGNIGTANDGTISISADDKDFYEDNTYKTGIEIMVPNSPNPPKEGIGTKTEGDTASPMTVRTITGSVWDDSRSSSVSGQFLGNGKYNTSDSKKADAKINDNVTENYKTSGVTEEKDIAVRSMKVEYVELVKIKQADGSYRTYEETLQYYPDGSNVILPWNPVQNIRTNDNGEYKLTGLIPGYYIVRYTYGDNGDNTYEFDSESGTFVESATKDMLIFNGQDYKSTTYTGVSDTVTNYDEILEGIQEETLSDARDDEIKRLETIAYSETMVNQKAEVLKSLKSDLSEQIKEKAEKNQTDGIDEIKDNAIDEFKELLNNTYMYADTVKFYVKPEKLDRLTDNSNPDNFEITYGGIKGRFIYKDLFDIEFGDTSATARAFEIDNLDFGIEYRPETQITLNKQITGINLITSDGTELVKLVLKDNGEEGEDRKNEIISGESVGLEYTQFISNEYKYIDSEELLTSEDYQGFVFVNVDDEILQGSTIEIEYSFTAENNSEVDRISEKLHELRYRQNDGVNDNKENFMYAKLDGDGTLYTESQIDDSGKFVYTSSGTAAKILRNTYGVTEDASGKYTTEEKKYGEYYGKYLGSLYYTGIEGSDVISSLKFDKILDYVDTDLVFSGNAENAKENTLWSTTTDSQLRSVFVKDDHFINNKLLNTKSISYVTYNDTDNPLTSNLVISVDDRIRDDYPDLNGDGKPDNDPTVNKELSRYLLPGEEGNIKLQVSKVIAAEEDTDNMQYENIAEVIQFTAQTGRRTNYATTIGNANVRVGEFAAATTESDTTATEVITLTPPTGLDRLNRVVRDTVEVAGAGIGISVIGIALVLGGFIIVRIIIQKIRKRPIK